MDGREFISSEQEGKGLTVVEAHVLNPHHTEASHDSKILTNEESTVDDIAKGATVLDAEIALQSPLPGDVEQNSNSPLVEPSERLVDDTVSEGLTSTAPNIPLSLDALEPLKEDTPPKINDDEREALERQGLELASKAQSVSELKEAYELLCKNFRTKTSSLTRPERQRLANRLCELGEPLSEVDVFVVTWNVGNAAPIREQLKHLIPVGNRLYDMVVVGLQECDYELTGEMSTSAQDYHKKRRAEKKASHDLHQKPTHWHTRNPSSPFVLAPSLRNVLRYANMSSSGEFDVENSSQKPFNVGHFMHKTARQAEHGAKRAMTSRVGSHFASVIHNHLGTDDYFMVRECELMQMRLFIFSRIEHRPRITHVEYASQATGIAGVVGNKGGVAVSLRFQDMRLCFLSCHLAAHRKFLTERNRDCADALGMLQRKLATHSASYLSDWDFVFLLGDLNYRLTSESDTTTGERLDNPLLNDDDDLFDESEDFLLSNRSDREQLLKPSPVLAPARKSFRNPSFSPLSRSGPTERSRRRTETPEKSPPQRPVATVQQEHETAIRNADHKPSERELVLNMITQELWDELMEQDQLRHEQRAGRVLMGFHEAHFYPFPPTFKVARTEEVTYNEKRLPAYCDRILWHATPSLTNEVGCLTQFELFSPTQVSTSDHKPVCSLFRIVPRLPNKILQTSNKEKSSLFWQPYLSRFKDSQQWISRQGMQIVVSNLKASNLTPMDLGRWADPYIVAYSTQLFDPSSPGYRPSKGICRTKVSFRCLSCIWDDVLLIRCPSSISRPEDLLGKHLTLSVWDFDTLTRDDHMGEVILSLDGLVHAFSNASPMVSDHFEGTAREANSHVAAQREDSDDQEFINQPTAYEGHEEQLPDGRKVHLQSKQLAFSLPVVQDGKNAGMLSGVLSLHLPTERVKSTNLKMSGLGWKFRVYWEQLNQCYEKHH